MKIKFPVFFLLSGLFCLENKAEAQERAFVYPQWNLRTSLTSFFEYDAGVSLGVGCRWNDRFSAAIEPTWILYNTFEDEFGNTYPSGVKLRADFKIYLNKKRSGKVDFFLAPEFHYKYVETQKQDRFGIGCSGGSCAFFQDAYYTEVKRELGGLVKWGLNCLAPFAHDPRFLLEIFLGFGTKFRKFREKDLPPGGSFVNQPQHDLFFGRGLGETRGVPLFPLGFKLLFVLNNSGKTAHR